MSLINEILLGIYTQVLQTDNKFSQEYLDWYHEWRDNGPPVHPPIDDYILDYFNAAIEVLEEEND